MPSNRKLWRGWRADQRTVTDLDYTDREVAVRGMTIYYTDLSSLTTGGSLDNRMGYDEQPTHMLPSTRIIGPLTGKLQFRLLPGVIALKLRRLLVSCLPDLRHILQHLHTCTHSTLTSSELLPEARK